MPSCNKEPSVQGQLHQIPVSGPFLWEKLEARTADFVRK
jgi:hypothetical protein